MRLSLQNLILLPSYMSRKSAHTAAKDAPMVVICSGDPFLQSVDWV